MIFNDPIAYYASYTIPEDARRLLAEIEKKKHLLVKDLDRAAAIHHSLQSIAYLLKAIEEE